MKYRVLGAVAGGISILAAAMPSPVRSVLIHKVKNLMYLIFG